MKKIIYIIILLILNFISLYCYDKKNDTIYGKNLENTISLEIKTWKYINDKNTNYYLNVNPHAVFKVPEKNAKFFNFDLILNNIYTEISIGTPSENIIGFFSGKVNTFKIFYLNDIKSETFNELSEVDTRNLKCSENFLFKSQNKTYEVNEMEFIKTSYSSKSLNFSHSFLGLQISSKDVEKIKKYSARNTNQTNFNFVESLQNAHCKKLNISNYYWTIKYFKNENKNLNKIDGIFYFGEPPHVYDPLNYNIEDFKEINTEAGYDNLYWGLKFDYIDFINKTTGHVINIGQYSSMEYCLIYPELNYFITTENFFSRIKKVFFSKFIHKKRSKNYNTSICYEKFASIADNVNLISLGDYNQLNGIYDIIYCNKTRVMEYGEEKFYNDFPIISFHHLSFGYNFEFNASDLFYEKEGELYFMMTLKIDRGDKWIFGKIFMKKYQIVFNNDMRTIGFYLKNKEKNKLMKPGKIINYDDNYNKNNKVIILSIIFVVIISGIIFYFFWVQCIKKRNRIFNNKRNAKELELVSNYNEIM